MALLRRAVFFAAILCAVFVNADEPKPIEIPLKDIWAYQIDGTRDVRELDLDSLGKDNSPGAKQRFEDSLVQKIYKALREDAPRSAFAVEGRGVQALRKTQAVFSEKKQSDTFPSSSEISLVFFSRKNTYYCELDPVEVQGDHIQIPYRFVPHQSADITAHFAIIPLGRLTPGKYTVEIVQRPMRAEFSRMNYHDIPSETATKIVGKSFSFTVEPK